MKIRVIKLINTDRTHQKWPDQYLMTTLIMNHLASVLYIGHARQLYGIKWL